MAGTKIGGEKAALKNKQLHGKDFYARIGALGGAKGTTGGFASDKRGADGLTGRERAQIKGREGGRISRRRKNDTIVQARQTAKTQADFDFAT